MNVRPILFNTEMVRAILDGRKTVTRRVVKEFIPEHAEFGYTAFTPEGCISCRGVFGDRYGECFLKLPYRKGDVLYVREAFDDIPVSSGGHFRISGRYYYKADGDLRPEGWKGNWKPSIHMPKEAARIWLKVKDVRVEKLQDCGNIQAKDEGYTCCSQFARVWDSVINKTNIEYYGWQANPWVWVIEFERIEKPEDEE